ncbi:MAG: cysteine--tRNA ligase [Candidatus Cloacimonetes bacterium]|nr:cysteine--tRNA ligase [Candidatus Cloacimonadota bacterium]MBL7149908.1 cysteine--tRNA ligase [Candidatus Cloacimonadota bacterium]
MKIYNTLTRKKEEFVPLEPGKVNIYLCGPTAYNYFHIGNARTFLFFDIVRNYFKYRGFQVTYVQNITDVDDKLIDQSIKEKIPVSDIAEKYINAFFEDTNSLGIPKADYYPHATKYIEEMVRLIKELEEKGYAYEVNGDVYFSINADKKYGILSGKKIEDLKAGARVEKNIQKKHPGDFTLWKRSKPGEPKWQSPWGEGRPGWHTECVVMSRKLLGETFDIHGGGIDLIFPHHENEIAQAQASTGSIHARYWMHGGYLNISGEKMSKSLDNFFLTRDVLKKYDAEAIRFFFLSKHYRSSIDYNEDLIKESSQAMKNLYSILKELDYLKYEDEDISYAETHQKLKDQFIEAMDDDFNTAKAISVLFEIAKITRSSNDMNFAHLLVELGQVLGFFTNLEEKLETDLNQISEELIQLLINYRQLFKKEQNWRMADKIRNDLKSLGIQLKDTPAGTEWEIVK